MFSLISKSTGPNPIWWSQKQAKNITDKEKRWERREKKRRNYSKEFKAEAVALAEKRENQ
jgi:hypothetical protein